LRIEVRVVRVLLVAGIRIPLRRHEPDREVVRAFLPLVLVGFDVARFFGAAALAFRAIARRILACGIYPVDGRNREAARVRQPGHRRARGIIAAERSLTPRTAFS
jgi:hypothetical protein